jgi:hypothetical protein
MYWISIIHISNVSSRTLIATRTSASAEIVLALWPRILRFTDIATSLTSGPISYRQSCSHRALVSSFSRSVTWLSWPCHKSRDVAKTSTFAVRLHIKSRTFRDQAMWYQHLWLSALRYGYSYIIRSLTSIGSIDNSKILAFLATVHKWPHIIWPRNRFSEHLKRERGKSGRIHYFVT